ncbi:hypothetical protein P879_01423 [Paragonimus westermani]|uniref:Cadherin domain-containing protein n=1 Tax=Paragonimus westermani TaxID=34504 RepID=A0A8T0DUU0_9TREM|nr:hypothetical protein P879_01423 [Paragonimus westermani]
MAGRAVGKLIATDADSPNTECGEIVYELKQDRDAYLFTIDSLTGEIRFKPEERWANQQSTYGINVLARNTGVFNDDFDEAFVEITQQEGVPDNLVSSAVAEEEVEKLIRRKRAVVNPPTELTFQIAKLPPTTTEDMCIGCSWKIQLTLGLPNGTQNPTVELFGAMNDTVAYGFVRNVVLKGQGGKITSSSSVTTSAISSHNTYGVTHMNVVLGQLQVSNTAGTAASDFEIVLEYETGLSNTVSLTDDITLTSGAGALLSETLWIGVMNVKVKAKSMPKFTLNNCPATVRPGDVIYISLSALLPFAIGDYSVQLLPSVQLTRQQPKLTDPMARTGAVFMMTTTFKEPQVYKPVTLRMEFDQPGIAIWDAQIHQVGNCLDSFVPTGLRFTQKGNTLDLNLPSIFITCVTSPMEAGITIRVVAAQPDNMAYTAIATVYVDQKSQMIRVPVNVIPFAAQPPLTAASIPTIYINRADAAVFNNNSFRTNTVNLLFATVTIKPEARTTYQFDVSTTQTPDLLRICAPRLLNFDRAVGFYTNPAKITGNKILVELGFLYHDDRSITVEPDVTTGVHGLTYAVPIIPKGPVPSSTNAKFKVNYDNLDSAATLQPSLIAGPIPTSLPALTEAGLLDTFDYNKLSTRSFSSSLAPGETIQIFYKILIRNTMCVSYTIRIINNNDDIWPVELGTAFVQAYGESVWCIDAQLTSSVIPGPPKFVTSEGVFNLGEVCTSDTTDSWAPVITPGAAAFSAKPGEELVIPLKILVPPGATLPNSRLQFECERTALLNEAQCTILKVQFSGGVNLPGMDREQFEQVLSSTFGITHALDLNQVDPDVLTASVTVMLADSKDSNQNTNIPFKTSAWFGDFSVSHTEHVNVNRDGTETVSIEFLVDVIDPTAATRATAGDTVKFQVTQRMLPASRLECTQQTLQIHLDDIFQDVKLESQLTDASQFAANPSPVDRKISEFQAQGFYFGQHHSMTFSMTVNPSMHLLHGSATLDATLLVELQCMTYSRTFLPPVVETEGRPARFVATALIPLAEASGCFEDIGLTNTLKIQDCQLSSFGFADPRNRVHNIRFNSAQGWKPPVRGGRDTGAVWLTGALNAHGIRLVVAELQKENDETEFVIDLWGCLNSTSVRTFDPCATVTYGLGAKDGYLPTPFVLEHRVFLYATPNLFFCDVTVDPLRNFGYHKRCYHTTDNSPIKWRDLGPVVSQILTYLPDVNALFAIGMDQQSLMQSDDLGQTWYGINRFRYQMRVVRSPLAVNATSLPWSVQPGVFDSSTIGAGCTAFVAGDWHFCYNGIYKGNKLMVDWNSACPGLNLSPL